MRSRVFAVLAAAIPFGAMAAPPLSAFLAPPQYDSMLISPGGTRLAVTMRQGEKHVLSVLALPDMKSGMGTWFGRDTDIDGVRWANDERLLLQPARMFHGYRAYKVSTGEIIGIDATGKRGETLFGYLAGERQTGTKIAKRQAIDAAGEVIDDLPGESQHVIVQSWGYGIEGESNAAYRMNIRDGRLEKLASSPLRNGSFVTDAGHRVSLVYGPNRAGDLEVYWRPRDNAEWQLKTRGTRADGAMVPVGPMNETEFFALDDRGASSDGVHAWNPATGEQRLLFRDPEADLRLAGVDPSGKPWVFIYQQHFPQYWYPDPTHPLARLHAQLTRQFPQTFVRVTSQTDDLSRAVVRISGARLPPVYLLVDVESGKPLQIVHSHPGLGADKLAPVDAIEFVARDGLKVRGFLTTPLPAATPTGAQKRLPLVVLVHGGPHGVADDADYDSERQLFASRGYAVLQVNYRGSGGRGRSFASAGYGRWGREIQDDITDGIRWAIQDGVADRSRICIYGASFGAYAALTGVFREPDLFKCAIGMAGIYDLPLMFEKGDIQTVDRGVNYLKAAVGEDMEELRRRSPVYNAEAIKAPVLLLHGKADQRAPILHGVRMRDALTKAGKSVTWISESGEAHGFQNQDHVVDAYERMLAFLDAHIGH